MPTCVAARPTPSASCMSADHPLGEPRELVVERLDLVGPHAQHRVAVLADLRQRDLAPRPLLGAIGLIVLVPSWS